MKHLLLLAICLSTIALNAQEFIVPKDIKLESKEDYEAQNDNVIAAVNWLTDTHLNRESKKRKRVNTYLLQWLTGTQTVSLTLQPGLADYGSCADCLMVYMGGYAKAVIEAGNEEDKLANNVAAIRTVLQFYQKSEGAIGKNKLIQKLLKQEEKGKLEAEVAKRM